jgi:hypothetical protein
MEQLRSEFNGSKWSRTTHHPPLLGRIEVEGGRSFKDAKLWPGGVREWDWTETSPRGSACRWRLSRSFVIPI